MLKCKFIVVCFVFIGLNLFAQRPTRLSRSEVGFLVGGMYYIGDLNPLQHFKNTQLAGGIMYRFNIHSRLSFRGNLIYGNIKGDDSQSSSDLLKNRNLNFNSSIVELASGVEFNYLPFEIGHDRYKGSAYILTELGFFRMNPMTKFGGDNIALQPLGTEGQGTSLSSHKNYSLTQICVPIGAGVRMSLGKKASLNVEFGLRKTFTDYIDDVHSDTYVDPVKLESQNGSIAASLSNRSIDGSRFGKRGTSSTNDWYVFTGMMLTFKLGNPSNCFYHN